MRLFDHAFNMELDFIFAVSCIFSERMLQLFQNPLQKGERTPVSEKTSSSNQSIEKMFHIIETMAVAGRPMRLNEIAEKSRVPASTAMRILNAMIDNGYASQNEETQLYSLSYKFLWIASNLRENLTLSQVIHPYLQEISKRVGVSCALGIRNGDYITYVDEVVSSQQMIRIFHHLGQSYDLYANGCGKLFLAEYSKAELNRYFQQHELKSITPKTLCTRAELEADLARTRQRGYSMNDEECLLGMRCISFPLKSSDGEVFAGISLSATIYQINNDNIGVYVSTVRAVLDRMYSECGPVFSRLQFNELI